MTKHRTSSIQRPVTGEVTRPTRRRRRSAADGTPGRGLPERPLPGRPGNVLRTDTVAAGRPSAPQRRAPGQSSATVGRSTWWTARREPGAPTQALPLTEPLLRRGTPDRSGGNRGRGSSRPGSPPRRDDPDRQRPLTIVAGQPDDLPAHRPTTPHAGPDAPKAATARRRPAPAGRTAKPATARTTAGPDARAGRTAERDGPTPGAAPGRRMRRGKDAAAAPAGGSIVGRMLRRKEPGADHDAVPRSGSRRRAAARDGETPRPSALRDVTRPIARDSRMAERRPVRIGYGLIAGAIGLALVAALVVLPIRRWWNQREDLADRRNQLDILRDANSDLANDIAALNTREGIEAEARTALNFGYPGEERTRSVGDPQAPVILPAGYPYSLVTSILAARTNLAAVSPNPVATTVPGAVTVPTDPAAGTPVDTTVPPATDPPEPTIAPPPGALTPSEP